MIYLLLLIIPLGLGLWAQHRVTSTYAKWAKVPSRGNFTGAYVASAVMRSAGIDDVTIVEIPGHLTDHFDPQNRRLALSSENYHGTSIAAIGVSAHESGHAIQRQVHYAPMYFRMGLVPVSNFASSLLPLAMIGGIYLHIFGLIYVGIGVYMVLTLFQLITMPVEFDASARALQRLQGLGILDNQEMVGARATLKAAAWTYVAAFVASVANLLYFVLAANRRR